MWWVIWILLLVASGVYLGMRVRGLWGHAKRCGSELAAAQRSLEQVQGQLEILGERLAAPQDLDDFSRQASEDLPSLGVCGAFLTFNCCPMGMT